MPAFGIWNASLKIVNRQHLLSGVQKVSLTVGVYNVFSKQYNAYEYISSGGYYGVLKELLGEPGAPRTVYVTLNAKF